MSKNFKLRKYSGLIIIIAIIVVLVVSFTFLGIFLYQRYTPNVRFNKAEKNWAHAQEKEAVDEIEIFLWLGQEDNALKLGATLDGTRTYKGNRCDFVYDVYLKYSGMNVLTLQLNIVSDGDDIVLEVEKKDGMVDFNSIKTNIEQEYLQGLELGNNKLAMYNTENISIDKNGEFFIEGDNSIALLLNSVSMIVKQFVDLDITDIINDKISVGKVRGDLNYKNAFKIKEINSIQNVVFSMPWEEADEIVGSMENIPEKIKEVYFNRKIKIENIPVLGSMTIDFLNYMPDRIIADFRLEIKTTYDY